MNPTTGVISESFELYKRHFSHLFVIAFLIYVVVSILGGLIAAAGGAVAALGAFALFMIGLYFVQAALVEAVADIRDGRADLSIGETLSRAAARLGPVAAAALLAGIAVAIGFIAFIIPGLFLMTIWAVIVPAIVLEGRGIFESFSRSQGLVKGYAWPVFGVVIIATILIPFAVSVVVGLISSPLPAGLQSFLSNIISGSLTAPFSALATTLLFFRLKEAKEGSSGTPPTQIA